MIFLTLLRTLALQIFLQIFLPSSSNSRSFLYALHCDILHFLTRTLEFSETILFTILLCDRTITTRMAIRQ